MAFFRCIFWDLHWDNETIKDQLYQGLSREVKDALSLHRLLAGNLESFIANCKNLHNRVQAENEERKSTGGLIRFSVIPTHNQNPR